MAIVPGLRLSAQPRGGRHHGMNQGTRRFGQTRDRLREMSLGEEQRIKLLSSKANVICQVCNARLALSEQLARAILVEPFPRPRPPSSLWPTPPSLVGCFGHDGNRD